MRKAKLLLGFLLILATGTLITGCKKDISGNSPDKETIEMKVNHWLSNGQLKNSPARKERIESIRKNLDFTSASIEVLNEREQGLIIPLKNGFIPRTNYADNPVNSLLLKIDKEGSIIMGSLVQFIPANKNNRSLPLNTLSNVLNAKNIDVDGRFVFLSIFDRLLHEQKYENGFRTSYKEMQGKNKLSDGRIEVEICIDWYLITTIHYLNGTSETTEEFITTTCYENCPPGELCDELEGGTGGSSGTGTDISIFVDETQYVEEDREESGDWVRIKYNYHATINRRDPGNIITSVIMSPITADPMVSWYTDIQQRTVRRSLVLFNHLNGYTILTPPTSVLLNWSCLVHATYSYTDGTPPKTRQWSNYYSATR
jgi:hypothetical protein